MPRHPHHSDRAASVLAGSFGRAPASRMQDLTRLHIGDSAVPPGAELPLSRQFGELSPWWFRYPAPQGSGRLRRALASWYTDHHQLPTDPGRILVAPGATAALNAVVHLLCDPGDEVLVPTPVWPLWPGMVRLAGATVRELPFHDRVAGLAPAEVARLLEESITPRTTLLYLNTPNNPSGTLLSPAQCEAVLGVARRHDLWVVSDEAYDGMAFDGRSTPSLAALAGDDERVLVVSTASKMHRAAGLRLGWLRTSADLVEAAVRVATFQVYSASALGQELLEPALRTREGWSGAVLAELADRRERFCAALGLDVPPPAGTYFCFLDLGRWLGPGADGSRAAASLLELGVCVTPGGEFGSGYEGWIRACFASEPVESTEAAARVIGQWIRDEASTIS